jgi:hypothetical protein
LFSLTSNVSCRYEPSRGWRGLAVPAAVATTASGKSSG